MLQVSLMTREASLCHHPAVPRHRLSLACALHGVPVQTCERGSRSPRGVPAQTWERGSRPPCAASELRGAETEAEQREEQTLCQSAKSVTWGTRRRRQKPRLQQWGTAGAAPERKKRRQTREVP